ncbi:DUF5937 family protein [Streptomyces sulphureus]|uniref:DUF5937 family protein n=1 Tax=Streptomyces sulphureus TaxID=47758 RepID=UPI000369EA8C|nr:DUF5937 family protein [Streptomyces sulphureus]
MSVTVHLTDLSPERTVFRPSPLAELGTVLHTLAAPAHHPGAGSWAADISARTTADLADRLCCTELLWGATFSDLLLSFAARPEAEGRPGETLAEDLDLLDKLDDEEYVTVALEFTCLSEYDSPSPRSPLHDEHLREQALALAAARGREQLDFTRRLIDDPPRMRRWMRRLFEECDEAFFADIWTQVGPRLTADARRKRDLLLHHGMRAALADVSPALSLDETGTRLEVDKLAEAETDTRGTGLTFVPTTFNWPHLMVLHRPRWRPVVHYPVAPPQPRQQTPASVEQFALRMEALAHPVRMRMCRSLSRSPHTTGELAEVYALSAPEVSRHLAVLRKAGLVTVERQGRYVKYQLDIPVVARLGGDFLETVLR